VRQLRRDCRTSKHRLRVRRPKLDVISAQCHQEAILPSDLELNPS
jgi:hypothetical protein